MPVYLIPVYWICASVLKTGTTTLGITAGNYVIMGTDQEFLRGVKIPIEPFLGITGTATAEGSYGIIIGPGVLGLIKILPYNPSKQLLFLNNK